MAGRVGVAVAFSFQTVASRIGIRLDYPEPNERETSFGRLCIIVLAVEWIVFGSLHFSAPAMTIRQVPDCLPIKHVIAVLSGMAEVVIGLLILTPRTRRAAASASLLLLVVYIWPVYRILAYPDVLGDPSWAPAFRLLLIPNNIFLGICSVFLIEHPDVRTFEEGGKPRIARRTSPLGSDASTWLVACLFLASNCAGFLSLTAGSNGHFPESAMWAMACLALGALLGFLFAVPKANRAALATERLLPNTNVEEVSDWLTKIIVGVGLVNFDKLSAYFNLFANNLAASVAITSTYAAALVLYFSILGIIEGYVLTRLFLARRFSVVELV